MKKIVTFVGNYKKEIGGLLRHVATIAGGVLIAKGSLTTDSFTMILGSTSSIVGTGWSFVNKASHKKEVKTALATDPVTGDVTRHFNEETKTWGKDAPPALQNISGYINNYVPVLLPGYLYIITNKSWPGWLKVGTTRNLNTRLQTYQTSSPFRDYEVIYSIKHPAYLQAEQNIKKQMAHFAKQIKNEWYEVDLQVAKVRLLEQLDNYFYGECDKEEQYHRVFHSMPV